MEYLFHPLTFSLYVSLGVEWVSCRQHIYGSCFYIHSGSLCLLVGAFKVMKGKNLLPGCLYPERISFYFDGEIKTLHRQVKVKKIQHHQTSFTTNAKGTSLGRKHKRRKRTYNNKPKTIKKMVIGTYMSIISLYVNGLNSPIYL